jgi:Fe-S-cluster containining protein
VNSETRLVRRFGDRLLLEVVDSAFAESSRLAGHACACRPGCDECCLGPFPINALDAWRLEEGLAALRDSNPARAEAVLARAREAKAVMQEAFPGDPVSGALGEDVDAEAAFCEKFAARPCPALDPETRCCDLYAWRPISCRTVGPPLRFADQRLPPCRLWFQGAPPEAVERARVEPDPEDLERDLIESIGRDGGTGDTIVAFALTRPDAP